MKATDDMVSTGQEAIDQVNETWQDVGMGKVEVEVIDPWLIVRRAGGDYSLFLSLVDGTAVYIANDGATTRHVPKDLRPDETLTSAQVSALEDVFEAANTGMYPVADDGVFVLRSDPHTGERFEVGLLDDTFGYNDPDSEE